MKWRWLCIGLLSSVSWSQQVQITSPLPLPISGTFSATTSTTVVAPIEIYGVQGSTIPVGYSVSTSSYLPVAVQGTVPVTGSLSSTPGPLLINTSSGGVATVGYQTLGASVPVNMISVGGSAASVNADGGILVHTTNGAAGGTSSNFQSAFPAAGTASGWMGPNGQMWSASVNQSSAVYSYQTNMTTVTFNGIGQPIYSTGTIGVNGNTTTSISVTTVTFNGIGQPVTGTFFQSVQPVSGNTTTSISLTTVTFNGSAQPVTQSGNSYTVTQGSGVTTNPWTVNSQQIGNSYTVTAGTGNFNITGSISNTGFNVNNVPTVLISTAGINSSTVAVVNAVGTTLAISGNLTGNQNVNIAASGITVPVSGNTTTSIALTTVTFNGTGQPVTQSGSWSVNQGIPWFVTQGSGAWTVSQGTGTSVNPWFVNSTQNGNIYTVSQGSGVATNPWTMNSQQIGNVYTVTQGSGTLANNWYVNGSTVGIVGTLADNGVAAGTNRLPILPTIYQRNYLNGTAATQGRNGALSQGTDGLLWTTNLPSMMPYSYHASSTVASAASATDIAVFSGNGSSTTLLTGIRISCTQTTAGNVTLSILKRSTADAQISVVASTLTVVPDDSNYGAAKSTAVYVYTSVPTTRGTLVGMLDEARIGCMASATATPNDIYISPSEWRMKPIVLRSFNDQIAVSLAAPIDQTGTTVTGGNFSITWEWMEVGPIIP